MQKLALEEIKQISLQILTDIDSFCSKNGINYSLGYGSLIGAVRHHGFIPWDDDIDIIMTRPEYDRFCASYISDKYEVVTHYTDKRCYIAFARICDKNTTAIHAGWCANDHGVWIDLFPIDCVEDDFIQFKTRYEKSQRLYRQSFYFREAGLPLSSKEHYSVNLKRAVLKLISLGGFISKIGTGRRIKYIRKIAWGTTKRCSQLGCPDNGLNEYLPTDIFKDYITMIFEGMAFKTVKRYDELLKNVYGDYMQLPPIEKRVPIEQDYFFIYNNHA